MWSVVEWSGMTIRLLIEGILDGLVTVEQQGWRLRSDELLSTSWSWAIPPAGGSTAELILTFSRTILASDDVYMRNGDLGMRNTTGGGLGAGTEAMYWTAPPLNNLFLNCTGSGAQLIIQVSETYGKNFMNGSPPAVIVETQEAPIAWSLQGNAYVLDFNGIPTPGDHVELTANINYFANAGVPGATPGGGTLENANLEIL